MYYAIWKELKSMDPKDASTKGVRISAPKALHKRIIKACKKEKWLDVGYKIRIEPRIATLESWRDNSIITFKLRFSLTSEDF